MRAIYAHSGRLFNNLLFFLVFKEFAFVEVVWMVYQFLADFYNQNHIFVNRKIYSDGIIL
ncbi:hypothetical protein EGM30_11820 [Salmonella enterica subsp. enterica]|nr:hypothetical protein [Salmonella enterica subsp. enterica serovar Lisboa]